MLAVNDLVNLRSSSPSPQWLTNDGKAGVQNVDVVSDSQYTSSNLRTDGQPNCSWSDCRCNPSLTASLAMVSRPSIISSEIFLYYQF